MTRLSFPSILLIFFSALHAWTALADETVRIDYDEADDKPPPDDSYFEPIEQIIQNPALIGGLAANADAINRSVESLMDSLFYSLLDNERKFYINDDAWFGIQLKRDVYSTPSGAYVVIDKIALGPRYAKELYKVHEIPISLGIDGTVEVLQINLRTDGQRLAEQASLPTWRRWANNWFGLVPGLATILPPSFNQNEMYDPIRLLETPFVFPLTTETFYGMPVGSIRSYAISGGVQLPIDFGGALDKASQDELTRIGGLKLGSPYTIFRRGEHRINVLRRSEHSAWVGLKELTRTGHALSPFVGTKYFILRGALAANIFSWHWVWTGVPISMLPIDLNLEQATANLYDHVYEYDLRNPAAASAYEEAVKGNFVPSRDRYLDQKEKGLETGVTFHFARVQDRFENVSRNGPNVAVYKQERQKNRTTAEVEITDAEGKFYVLEGTQDVEDEAWDILVGGEEKRLQQTVEMRVRKVLNKDNPDDTADYSFAFEAVEDPTVLNINMSVQDRYVDVAEYDGYLEDLRFVTGLPLDKAPKLDLQDQELQKERRRRGFFADPGASVSLIHVPATYLGRFGATASMSFDTQALQRILDASDDDKWRAFAKSYGVESKTWLSVEGRASFAHSAQWFKAFVLYPLRLFNTRVASADAIKEATTAINALAEIKKLETPVAKLEAFYKLLDADHPERLTRALLNLSDLSRIPRRISFSAQPKGAARQAIKDRYGKLHNTVVKEGPPFPDPGRYARAKKKLAAFYLDQPRESIEKPRIARIVVGTRTVPESVRGLGIDPDLRGPEVPVDPNAKHVFITISVARAPASGPLKLYVRAEEGGKIKIGKLELAADVLELSPSDKSDPAAPDILVYEFFLTGPLSPLSSYLFDRATKSGSELQVTMAASRDGQIFSDERSVEFLFQNGDLLPAKQ